MDVTHFSRLFIDNDLPEFALSSVQLLTKADRKRDVTALVFERCPPVEMLQRMERWKECEEELPSSPEVVVFNVALV